VAASTACRANDELDTLPLFQPSAATGLSEKVSSGLTSYLLGETDQDMRCGRIERFFQNIHSMIRGHQG
jgi:hypothetical protein